MSTIHLASNVASERSALDALRQEALLLAVIGFIVLAFPGSLLGLSWLAGAAALWGFVVAVLSRSLFENRTAPASALLPSIGWANVVTLQRGWLLAMTAGFLLLPQPPGWLAWAPAFAYSAAALLDHADGRLARRLGVTTRLGAKLDMELDAAGILVASALAIRYGKLPVPYLAIGLARYAFVAAIAWRAWRGRSVRPLHQSALRRWLAGFQMGFLAAALWPLVPAEASNLAAPVFGAATLLLFARDWLVASCRLDPEGAWYAASVARLEAVRRGVTLSGKVVALVGFGVLILQGATALPKAMGILGAISMGAGVLRRTGAFLVMAAATLVIGTTGLDGVSAATLVTSLLVLVFEADG